VKKQVGKGNRSAQAGTVAPGAYEASLTLALSRRERGFQENIRHVYRAFVRPGKGLVPLRGGKQTDKKNRRMTMQWEEMTAPELEAAARKPGVCIFSMGVVEQHAAHLPLGTDYLLAHRLACLAAEREKVVVFPPWYLGQIYEARCFPGVVTVSMPLLLQLLEEIFDEIARNGFRKIVLVNGHGGNRSLLPLLAQCTLAKERAYTLYVLNNWVTPERKKEWDTIVETKQHGHACECETSLMLACYPELVKMERVPAKPWAPLGRLSHLPGNFSGISWYSRNPEHYAGDARPATAEKGKRLAGLIVDTIAEFLAAVKADKVAPALEKEFYERVRKVGKGKNPRRRSKVQGLRSKAEGRGRNKNTLVEGKRPR
jgi:creatinine amidohydrolase